MGSLASDNPTPLRQIADALAHYRDLLIVGPAVLFVLGFVIVNLHLGSIGIVNFDLFRARYILVGALFLGFLASLGAMIRGLLHRVAGSRGVWRSIRDALGYSFTVYGIPLVLVMFLTSLSGEGSPPAIWLVGVSPAESSLDWALGDVSDTTQRAAIALASLMGVYLLGVVFFVARPPKNPEGERRPRREVLKGAFIGLGIVLGLWAFLVFAGAAARYLGALTTARALGNPRQTQANWTPFVTLHLAIYVLVGVFMLVSIELRKQELKRQPKDSESKRPVRGTSIPGLPIPLEGVLLILAFLIPLYTLAAYPGIPQQVGGGAVIPVAVTVSSGSAARVPARCQNPMFLVDRTPRTTILVLTNQEYGSLRTLELSNDEVLAVEYYPECP